MGFGGRSGYRGRDTPTVHDRPGEREGQFWSLGSLSDSAHGVGSVTADELIGAVDYHLRGIDLIKTQALTVEFLPVGVLARSEAVVPLDALPVVDVLAEDDDVGVLDGLIVIELRQQRVGWRATGAALRGEELYQDWSTDGWSRLRVRGLDGEERQSCGDNDGCDAKLRHGPNLYKD